MKKINVRFNDSEQEYNIFEFKRYIDQRNFPDTAECYFKSNKEWVNVYDYPFNHKDFIYRIVSVILFIYLILINAITLIFHSKIFMLTKGGIICVASNMDAVAFYFGTMTFGITSLFYLYEHYNKNYDRESYHKKEACLILLGFTSMALYICYCIFWSSSSN
jgi:hypothetical protein